MKNWCRVLRGGKNALPHHHQPGHHWGLYKALLKDDNWQQKKTSNCTPANNTDVPPATNPDNTKPKPEPNGADVMHLVHKFLVLAIQHSHTFNCWKRIWNFFIENDLGNPNINSLHTLHIVKADYNLLLKWFRPQGCWNPWWSMRQQSGWALWTWRFEQSNKSNSWPGPQNKTKRQQTRQAAKQNKWSKAC